MRILFYGTPEFAIPALEMLRVRHEIAGVVTQVDRPAKRGLKLHPSPVKRYAKAHNLPLFQPASVKDADFLENIKKLKCDLGVVVAYGRFIPTPLLELPRLRTINIHPSLLPRYRGAAPINWALINGDTLTGVSIIYLVEEMDAGDIIHQVSLAIEIDDNSQTLSDKLAQLGAECLFETINQLERKTGKTKQQDEKRVTFAPPLKKEQGLIDWNQPAAALHNLARGLNPHWPVKTTFQGKQLRIKETRVGATPTKQFEPGAIIALDRDSGPLISCGQNTTLQLTQIQLPNKKPMSGGSFLNGYHVKIGEKLG